MVSFLEKLWTKIFLCQKIFTILSQNDLMNFLHAKNLLSLLLIWSSSNSIIKNGGNWMKAANMLECLNWSTYWKFLHDLFSRIFVYHNGAVSQPMRKYNKWTNIFTRPYNIEKMGKNIAQDQYCEFEGINHQKLHYLDKIY